MAALVVRRQAAASEQRDFFRFLFWSQKRKVSREKPSSKRPCRKVGRADIRAKNSNIIHDHHLIQAAALVPQAQILVQQLQRAQLVGGFYNPSSQPSSNAMPASSAMTFSSVTC